MSCCYMKHLLNPVFMQVKAKKYQKGFQALEALVAKKLSQTILLQLCLIFFFQFAWFLDRLYVNGWNT